MNGPQVKLERMQSFVCTVMRRTCHQQLCVTKRQMQDEVAIDAAERAESRDEIRFQIVAKHYAGVDVGFGRDGETLKMQFKGMTWA
jgi:hypothetical protein